MNYGGDDDNHLTRHNLTKFSHPKMEIIFRIAVKSIAKFGYQKGNYRVAVKVSTYFTWIT